MIIVTKNKHEIPKKGYADTYTNQPRDPPPQTFSTEQVDEYTVSVK